jgi:hypothetical protein
MAATRWERAWSARENRSMVRVREEGIMVVKVSRVKTVDEGLSAESSRSTGGEACATGSAGGAPKEWRGRVVREDANQGDMAGEGGGVAGRQCRGTGEHDTAGDMAREAVVGEWVVEAWVAVWAGVMMMGVAEG